MKLLSAISMMIGLGMMALAAHSFADHDLNSLTQQVADKFFELGLVLTLAGAWFEPAISTLRRILRAKSGCRNHRA
jgi:hypothetical protein